VTVHRFFVSPAELDGDSFPVPGAIAHQVGRVLRLRDGAPIVLLDGLGTEVHGLLADGGSRVEVVDRRAVTGEPHHRLTLCQALLKGDALDRVIQQGTELGVAHFRLFVSERCVAREASERRLERLRSIARESAEQSERGLVPPVDGPVPFRDVLEQGAVLLFERLDGAAPGLTAIAPPGALVIGPEGGFSADELAAARSADAVVASLGPRILRSESVAIAAAAVVLSRAGDFA
jgi:16S rRNA (uracil1498-N3)-methyltransferase